MVGVEVWAVGRQHVLRLRELGLALGQLLGRLALRLGGGGGALAQLLGLFELLLRLQAVRVRVGSGAG